jgi:hypothetical protein
VTARKSGRATDRGDARGIFYAWQWWEQLAHLLWRVDPIPGAEEGVFRVRFTTFRGDAIALPDGTSVDPGDRVIELHVDNRSLMPVIRESRWNAVVRMRADLRALALAVERGEVAPDFKALWGLSLLSRGSEILGFTVRPRRVTLSLRFQRIYMAGLLKIYTAEGRTRLRRGSARNTYPGEVWMSRSNLLRRYGSDQ